MVEESEEAKIKEIGLGLKKFREYLKLSRQDAARALYLNEANVTDIEEGKDWNQLHATYIGVYYEAQLAKVSCYILGKMIAEGNDAEDSRALPRE